VAVALADHEDSRVRAEAGIALAASPDLAQIGDVLVRLLLDPSDTFVTSEIAEALISRVDGGALRLLCVALSRANEQQINWIYDRVIYQESIFFDPEEQRTALALLASLSEGADADVAREAATLITVIHRVPPTA
jgi:hypothetical protein